MKFARYTIRVIVICAVHTCATAPQEAFAETLALALSRAYLSNPELNKKRATVRVRDEEAPKALAGLRPKANIQASAGPQFSNVKVPTIGVQQGNFNGVGNNSVNFSSAEYRGYPRGATLNVSQMVYDGGATSGAVGRAQSDISTARAVLKLIEQNVLQTTATVYMDVLRDASVVSLRKKNIAVLERQLSQTQYRFQIGELTRTDVAQADSSLAQARSDLYLAIATLQESSANYRRIVGVEPEQLEPARPLDSLLPKSLTEGVADALVEHPSIIAALHQVNAAEFTVAIAESALSPTLSLSGQVANQYDALIGYPGSRQFSASISGQLNVPLYQGGSEYAAIRQAKEQLGEARLNADMERDGVRSNVRASFAKLKAVKAAIVARQESVKAAELALEGVREEAVFGQRTTLDILNAQQRLLDARVAIVSAQRDHVVASFAALAALGRLSVENLELGVAQYDPAVHYDQVKERWIGVRTPGSR